MRKILLLGGGAQAAGGAFDSPLTQFAAAPILRTMLHMIMVLAALLPAGAGEHRPAKEETLPLRVQRMSEHAAEQDRALALLRRLHQRYPALFEPSVLLEARFRIVKEKANQSFSQQDKALIINPLELFVPWADASFYRSGSATEPEAVLFHELLHAWSHAHPGLEDEYQSRVSGGRQAAFIAEANEGHRPAKEHRERVRDALVRIRIGSATREEYALRPGPPGLSSREQAETDYDRAIKLPLAEAEAIVREFQAEAEAAAGMMARLLGVATDGRSREEIDREIAAIRNNDPARFATAQGAHAKWVGENSVSSKLIAQGRKREAELAIKHKIPGRRADDRHAGDSPAEWFSYGGELAAYAAAPETLLSPEELEFWRRQFALMKNGG